MKLATLANRRQRGKAVHVWHLHVEKNDVGRGTADRRNRLAAGACLADLLNVGVAFEEPPDLSPRRRLVVDDEDADHVRYGTVTVTSRPPSARFSSASACAGP